MNFRCTTEVLKSRGELKSSIVWAIGTSNPKVSTEVERNCDQQSGQYRADLSQFKYELC